MSHVASPAPAEKSPEMQPAPFWGSRREAAVWAGLALLVAYFAFGVGVLGGVVGLIIIFRLTVNLHYEVAMKQRILLLEVLIIGAAYQFMGFLLITGPNIGIAKSFFENAQVEFSRGRLVDSMNWRLSMSKITISGHEFDKLVGHYRAKAESSFCKEYSDPAGFAYFELASETVDRNHLASYRSAPETFTNHMLNYEKNEGWERGVFMDGQTALEDLQQLMAAFPEINHGTKGHCRVLVWYSGSGDHRFFIWFSESQTGYLKCQGSQG